MTPAPTSPASIQGPLSQSARDQEAAMFQHLVSCCHPPSSDAPQATPPPSTKRPRQDQADATMPQAGQSSEPAAGDRGKGKNKGKGKGKGKGKSKGKGPRSGQTQGPNKQPWWNTSGSGGEALTEWDAQAWGYVPQGGSSAPPPVLGQMARLLLRHEKQLQAVQQDMKLHFFFRPDPPGSVLPFMTQVAKRWRELMDQNKVQSSLRETMLRELIHELKGRIQGFTAATMVEMQKKAHDMEWVDSQSNWNYMKWDPEQQKEVLIPRVESRSVDSLLQDLGEIERLISGTTIRHFGSVRPLSQNYATQWVQFVLEIELRQDGDTLWSLFNSLNCAVLHLLGARLRRDRPVDSYLAQTLQHFLWEGRLANPTSKTCYMNSALNALLFVIYSLGSTCEADLGQLRHAYQALLERAAALDIISRLLTWIMFISPWAAPFQQHDVGEFLQHIVLRIRSPLFLGLWQARQEFDNQCRIVDSGPAFAPVLLPLSEDSMTLQSCIDQWSAQDDSAIQHAITADTTSVLFQLMRFNAVGTGKRKRTVKDSKRVDNILSDILWWRALSTMGNLQIRGITDAYGAKRLTMAMDGMALTANMGAGGVRGPGEGEDVDMRPDDGNVEDGAGAHGNEGLLQNMAARAAASAREESPLHTAQALTEFRQDCDRLRSLELRSLEGQREILANVHEQRAEFREMGSRLERVEAKQDEFGHFRDEMAKRMKDMESELREVKSRSVSPVQTPRRGGGTSGFRAGTGQAPSPAGSSVAGPLVDDWQLVLGGYADAKREEIQAEVRALFEEAGASPLLKNIITPFVRSNICRMELLYLDEGFGARRGVQQAVIVALRKAIDARGKKSTIMGQERASLWVSRNRGPEERNRNRALLGLRDLGLAHLPPQLVDLDWKGRLWYNGTQVLYHVDRDDPTDDALMFLSTRGDESGWWVSLRKVSSLLQVSEDEVRRRLVG
ncbi:unnamed protein product [Symbiodinium sp. CCMP2592]|nr:unnamed protein product [Symbiodinium sp. CCMP2592]